MDTDVSFSKISVKSAMSTRSLPFGRPQGRPIRFPSGLSVISKGPQLERITSSCTSICRVWELLLRSRGTNVKRFRIRTIISMGGKEMAQSGSAARQAASWMHLWNHASEGAGKLRFPDEPVPFGSAVKDTAEPTVSRCPSIVADASALS